MTLPTGYDAVQVGRTRGFACHGAGNWARRALEAHGSLDAWAATVAGGHALTGRGTAHAVAAAAPGPEERTEWVVRRYLRGGLVAAVLHDRYLRSGRTRPRRELDASVAARARGIPTPAVVAGAVYPAGPFHYRADLVTELVPDSLDLASVLFGDPGTGGGSHAALLATGRLLARAGAAGIRHADLNARNVVLSPCASCTPEAWMVDLDRCRVRRTPRPGTDTGAMLARLQRSLRKLGEAVGRPLDDGAWAALREGVERPDPEPPRASDGPRADRPA